MPSLIFEHIAFNVPEPHAMKAWYQQHLALTVVSEMDVAPYMIFMADASGRVVFELYDSAEAPYAPAAGQHHLSFHMAFETGSAADERDRLLQAGCQLIEEIQKPDGSTLVMMRDPWGFALQICQRSRRMNQIPLP